MSLKHSCPSWGMSIPYDCTLKGMNVYDKYLTYDFVKHLFSMNSSNCVYAKRTECTNRTETCIYENVQCDLFKKWENIQGSAEGNMWEGSYKLWWKTDTPPPLAVDVLLWQEAVVFSPHSGVTALPGFWCLASAHCHQKPLSGCPALIRLQAFRASPWVSRHNITDVSRRIGEISLGLPPYWREDFQK